MNCVKNKINKIVNIFTNHVIKAVKPHDKLRRIPWWNNKIKESIKLKNKALKIFQRLGLPEEYIKLKELRSKTLYFILRTMGHLRLLEYFVLKDLYFFYLRGCIFTPDRAGINK